MRSRMIAFSGGIMLILLLPQLPHIPYALLLLLFISALVCAACAHWGAYLAATALGFIWVFTAAQWQTQRILPEYLEGQDLWLIGTVSSLPEYQERSVQFVFEVEESCASLLPKDCDWAGNVFSPRKILLSSYAGAPIETGQRWMWRVRLNRPHGFANPGSFDYEAWMFEQGLSAKGYVRQTNLNAYLETQTLSLDRLRFLVYTHLSNRLKGLEYRSLILALVMGVRDGIDTDVWNLLTITGTNHLMVISGLHIGLCSLFAYALGNVLARLFPALLLRVPAQKVGVATGLLSAAVYAALAGFTVPTQRALIMLAVFALARLFGRKFAVSTAYGAALFCVLLLHPLSVLNAGFWLSFAAVGTLLLALSGFGVLARGGCDAAHDTWLEKLVLLRRRWIRPQWVVSIGLCVPMIVWLQQVSVLSPLVNFFAIPVVSLIVVPASLVAAILAVPLPQISLWLFRLANHVLAVLLDAMSHLNAIAGDAMIVKIGAPGGAALLCLVLGTLILLMPRGVPGKLLGVVLLLPAFVPRIPELPEGQARVTVLDVGQGLAVLISTARHSLLYDTGPSLGVGFDAGRGVVVPYAVRQSIKQLDLVIVSHGDNDHAGGLRSILELLDVDALLSSSPRVLVDKAKSASFCTQGQEWTWDGVRFSILHPVSGADYEGNDSSCVLMVEAGSQRVLVPGDIERGAENSLVGMYAETLAADVLIAPHHGSNTSSSDPFIASVVPSILVFSAGYRSQFRHPAPQVLERYKQTPVQAYNTAVHGAVRFTLGAGQQPIAIDQFRSTRQRFWQPEFGEDNLRLHGVTMEPESAANSDLRLTGTRPYVLK